MALPFSPSDIRDLLTALRARPLDIEYRDAVRLWGIFSATPKEELVDAALQSDLREAIKYLGLTILPILSDKQLEEYLSDNIIFALDTVDYNLIDTLRRNFLNHEIIEDRDDLRRKLQNMLLDNTQIVTTQKASERTDGSVGQWLHTYMVTNPENESLKRAQFFSKTTEGSNQYPQDEQKRLKRLIELFDYLRLSSAGEGFEEETIYDLEDGKFLTLEKGQEVVTDPKTDPFIQRGIAVAGDGDRMRALEALKPGPLEDRAAEYEKKNPLTAAAAVELLNTILAGKDKTTSQEQALAALHVGLSSSVDTVLLETGADSLQTLFNAVLVRKLGLHPDAAVAIAGRTVAKLSPADRKAHGREVYYDMVEGKFVWGDPVIVPITP